MSGINLNDRIFSVIETDSESGVDDTTRFYFQQSEDIVHASYEGGGIRFGSLIGLRLPDDSRDVRYHHVDADGVIRTGTGRITPERTADGRVRLTQAWTGDAGTFTIVTEESEPADED